ncbi:hypothetical protein AWN90_32255 [Nocardia terpenica]|uniref:Uncharacterized protein n=2 Tax=Nocardia terpenica TaxID=455432 RepID=A0A164MGA5_9NOCA|nr:hypothetical protein AWN90_32255 [Nocardia terpenica]
MGKPQKVSQEMTNCSPADSGYQISWSQTTSTTDTAGVAVTVAMGTTIQASIQANYSRSWSATSSETSSMSATAKPGQRIWLERQVPVQAVKGNLTARYENRMDGHYIWIIKDKQYIGPPITPTDLKPTIVVRSAPATCPKQAA